MTHNLNNPPLHPLRIAPMEEADIPADLLTRMKPWRVNGKLYNLFKTYARNPKMSDAWSQWGAFVFARTSLSGRQTELLILRTTWLCRSVYEFTHHTVVAAQRGLSNDEIACVATQGSLAPSWDTADRLLLQIAEQIEATATVTDETWAACADNFSEQQFMDAVMTCGTYRIGSIVTNSFGIQLETDLVVADSLVPVIAVIGDANDE